MRVPDQKNCPCGDPDCEICREKGGDLGWKQVVLRVRNPDTLFERFGRMPDTFIRLENGWAVREPDQPSNMTAIGLRGEDLLTLMTTPERARRLAHWLPTLLPDELELVAIQDALIPKFNLPPVWLPWGGDEAA